MLDRPFDAQNYERIVIKVTDFGFCRSPYEPYRGTSFRRVQHPFDSIYCGTLPYSAPELMQKRYYNPLTNDLWALGVMLYEMLSGNLPFDAMEKRSILRLQMKGVTFGHSFHNKTKQSIDVITGILQYNVEERFVLRDILFHPFVFERFIKYERSRLGASSAIVDNIECTLLSERRFVAPYRYGRT